MYIPLTFEGSQAKCLIASSSFGGSFISGGFQYEYHVITGSSQFQVYNGSLEAELMVVGGGGGGAWKTGGGAGGGGGAQVLYYPNQRFFAGTYDISIGLGGDGGYSTGSQPQGLDGESTTISGANISYTAIGGKGASSGNGAQSGDGYSGGSGYDAGPAEGGGGGGGSRGVGQSVTSLAPTEAGDGGSGFTMSVANYTDSYGCGGGGGSSSGGNSNGFSCNGFYGMGSGFSANSIGSAGTNNKGGGGGGGWFAGGDGGSGVVVIQYKVNDYCKNYFYETGSCDCKIVTMDVTEDGGYYPDGTGSYLYLPCGGTNYELYTGSLKSFYEDSICVVSGSYYFYTKPSNNFIDPESEQVVYGLADNTLMECSTTGSCVSASVLYTPNCSSSAVIAFRNSSTFQNAQTYFVPRNSGSLATSAVGSSIQYKCAVTASGYPLGILGGYQSVYGPASCTQYNHSGFLPAGGSDASVTYYACGGILTTHTETSGRFTDKNFSFNFCADTSFGTPTISSGTGTPGTLTGYGNCLTGSLLPSCGCP